MKSTIVSTLLLGVFFACLFGLPIAANADGTPASVTITVNPSVVISQISPDFIGFGYETAAAAQAGYFSDKDTTLVRLYRNLTPSGLIRIGGNVSDHAIYEPDSISIPEPQSKVTIVNHDNLVDLGSFARATGWKVMWGLNAESDTIDDGVVEAKAVTAALGPSLQSFEIGNEVQGHPQFGGKFDNYYAYYRQYKAAVRKALPNAPLSGPDSWGASDWVGQFGAMEEGDVKLLTDHYYYCAAFDPSATTANLLHTDPVLVDHLQQLHRVSLSFNAPYRMNEMNSFWNGGKAGVSDTFASALWALDSMYLMATYGCDGVNYETDINNLGFISHYSPIVHDESGQCFARPEYYGMLAFSMAGHGDLVATDVEKSGVNVTAYATKPSVGIVWVTIINKDLTSDAKVTIPLPPGFKHANEYQLTAPSVTSQSDITLGGASVDADGRWRVDKPKPASLEGDHIHELVKHGSALLIEITR
jgi:hypothetical protein